MTNATPGPGRLPSESATYREIRDRLLREEIALRDQRERVAALRRRLPLDTAFEDYRLRDAAHKDVALSDLFVRPDRPLVLYHYMYGGAQRTPCPMCTLILDGLAGLGPHLDQVANFAVVAAAEIDDFATWAGARGWRNLRLLSSKDSTLKRDLGFEDAEGGQLPGMTVVVRRGDGLRHAYSGSAVLGDAGHRGLDLFMPLWHLLDLTPGGRGEWLPSLCYD